MATRLVEEIDYPRRACQEAHTPAPELRYEHTALWVEFRFLPEHTVSATQKITGEVTGEVERLVLALEGRMSRVQIQRALGLRHEDHFRAKYLIPALQSGFVEMTLPDRPKSSRQQYRRPMRFLLPWDCLQKVAQSF